MRGFGSEPVPDRSTLSVLFREDSAMTPCLKQVRIEDGTLVWPGEIDLPPHVMHDEIERNGVYVPQ